MNNIQTTKIIMDKMVDILRKRFNLQLTFSKGISGVQSPISSSTVVLFGAVLFALKGLLILKLFLCLLVSSSDGTFGLVEYFRLALNGSSCLIK